MSSSKALEESFKTMVSLGLMSNIESDRMEHSVDDTTHGFNELTSFIQNNPSVYDLIQEIVVKQKLVDLISSDSMLYVGRDVSSFLGYVLPNANDLTFSCDDNDNLLLAKIYLSSKELSLKNQHFAYKTVNEGVSSYYLDKKIVDHLHKTYS